ncbi:MAG TPA: hydrogenase maturation protease [Candidatus Paceibacterota bacterium]|nr:hydrogenase maturation protease [Verrucomicrobiota bacterium]HSA12113.1 hydrogenase maturation protease [Candidatus Paceibacterota bacterium]
MLDLREQLQHCFQGRVCLIGLGNLEYGDDGFGVRLAEELRAHGNPAHVIVSGTAPERIISRVADEGFDHIIFLDAAEFGGAPGSVILLNSDELAARFPQVSTHKLSLGLLAKRIEANSRSKAWLLGAQPGSVRQGAQLSQALQATLELLLQLLREIHLEAIA